MPSQINHFKKAKHNKDFFYSLDIDKTLYKDWVVVGIFYTALHLIEAYFAPQGRHFFSHYERDDWIKHDWSLKSIWFDYHELKQFRQKASYKMQRFNAEEIRNEIIPHLESIKNYFHFNI